MGLLVILPTDQDCWKAWEHSHFAMRSKPSKELASIVHASVWACTVPQTNDRSEMSKLDDSYCDRVWHLCANDLAKVEVTPPSTSLADERQVDTQVSVRWSAQDPGGFRTLWSSQHELYGASFPDIYGIEVAGPLVILAT